MKLRVSAVFIASMFLISGCGSKPDSQSASSDLAESFDAIYFTPVFTQNIKSEINISDKIRELDNEYTFESESSTIANEDNVFTSKYQHKKGGASNGGEITCEYLGNWRGKDLVYRHYHTGGSGHFSDIVLCSKNGELFQIHDVILRGDRACDGILQHPIYDENGRIFFYAYISHDTLLQHAGIGEDMMSAEDHSCYICYNVIGKCVHDLTTGSTEILSMNIIAHDNNDKSKIKTLLLKSRRILDKDGVRDFLKKLKELYTHLK